MRLQQACRSFAQCHSYQYVIADFYLVFQVECNPEYNTVIGPRTTTTKALVSEDNADSGKKTSVGEKLSNGIVIGHHASPGSSKHH